MRRGRLFTQAPRRDLLAITCKIDCIFMCGSGRKPLQIIDLVYIDAHLVGAKVRMTLCFVSVAECAMLASHQFLHCSALLCSALALRLIYQRKQVRVFCFSCKSSFAAVLRTSLWW